MLRYCRLKKKSGAGNKRKGTTKDGLNMRTNTRQGEYGNQPKNEEEVKVLYAVLLPLKEKKKVAGNRRQERWSEYTQE